MAKTTQEYCVVAANRETGIREAISDPYSDYARADAQRTTLRVMLRKTYKYFHVAKSPYKPRKHGGGKL